MTDIFAVHSNHNFIEQIKNLNPTGFLVLPTTLSHKIDVTKGPFKYYLIMFLTFLCPPTNPFDDLQYCKSSKIAIF